MQWSDGPQAGFTDGTPWIPVARNYRDINAKNAINEKDSIFYHYQQLIRLRKTHDVIVEGEYKALLMRSEEHTSELQSRGHLVCRLLLAKKKESNKTT